MISQTTEYALRAVVWLASHPETPLTAQQIARHTHVPAGYLAKVLQSLSRAGLLRSQRGLGGGFCLARKPAEITIWEVVQAVDPMRRITSCPLGLEGHSKGLCRLHQALDHAIATIEKQFSAARLSHLIEPNVAQAPLCAFEPKGRGRVKLTRSVVAGRREALRSYGERADRPIEWVSAAPPADLDMTDHTIRLLIACPDRRGIIAAVAAFISRFDGNILDADQHVDPLHDEFFMRVEIEPVGFCLGPGNFSAAWQPVADEFGMRWQIHWGDVPRRLAVLVSRSSHCLLDLLWRWKNGELGRAEIPLVASNHPDLRATVEREGIRFEHVPVSAETRTAQEARLLALLREQRVELVVLARYMQVLSRGFVAEFPARIINIHHGFLPAFSGAQPYHQAYERGVKLIGATSHYATDALDDGPIIAQQTVSVDHRDSVQDMIRKGRDLERMVLAEAVRLHLEDRILVSGRKTIVFG